MSKKELYKVYYNESFNSFVAIESHLKRNETAFCKYVGTFTNKQIKRIQKVLKKKSLSLSELKYMLELDSKFRYKIEGRNTIFAYRKLGMGFTERWVFQFPIKEKEQLPESDSLLIGPWKVTQKSPIEDVMKAVFGVNVCNCGNNINSGTIKCVHGNFITKPIPKDMRP